METETKLALTGIALMVGACAIKPIHSALSEGIRNYIHHVQETYRGYGVSTMIQDALNYEPQIKNPVRKQQGYEPEIRRQYLSRPKSF